MRTAPASSSHTETRARRAGSPAATSVPSRRPLDLLHLRPAPGDEAHVRPPQGPQEVKQGVVRGEVEGALGEARRLVGRGLVVDPQHLPPAPVEHQQGLQGVVDLGGAEDEAQGLAAERPFALDDADAVLVQGQAPHRQRRLWRCPWGARGAWGAWGVVIDLLSGRPPRAGGARR